MWLTLPTFRLLCEYVGGRPVKNAKKRFDKRSYVVAVVERLFADEPESERRRLIELHSKMKPSDAHRPPTRSGRGADHPDVYAALASMGEEEREVFDKLWQQASLAESARANAGAPAREGEAEPQAGNVGAEEQAAPELQPPPAEAPSQPAGSQDLGQDRAEHRPAQRTDWRTPMALRALLPGQGAIIGAQG